MAVLGAVGSLVGIWAFVDARKNKRVKLLGWERSFTVPLASAANSDDYKLSILYERSGVEPEVLSGAYLTYLRFANFGKEPIRRADIAAANPLRVVVKMCETDEGARVLDISLSGSSRDVARLEVGALQDGEDEASAPVSFDFLDYHDGGVVSVFTSGRPASVEMCGDVIGMPEGVVRTDAAATPRLWAKVAGPLGVMLWVLAELAGMGLAAWLFFNQTGASVQDLWLLLLPPVLFLAILVAAIWISDHFSPFTTRKKFPSALALPRRYTFKADMQFVFPYVWDEEREYEGLSSARQRVSDRG